MKDVNKKAVKFLRFVVVMAIIAIFFIGLIFFISLLFNPVDPKYAVPIYPIIACIYIALIPLFAALCNLFKFLGRIGGGDAFSPSSAEFLRRIKLCFALISAVFSVNMPFVVILADLDDAPGAILFGLIPVVAAAVISVFFLSCKNSLTRHIKTRCKFRITNYICLYFSQKSPLPFDFTPKYAILSKYNTS